MPPNDRNKLNRVEELKTKLFSKGYQMKTEHRDKFTHMDHSDVPDAWEGGGESRPEPVAPQSIFMKTSIFKNFFIFSIIFFIITIGYALYVFFAGSNTVSNNNIDITITGNNFTAGGEELSFVVGIANKNNSALDLVDLVMEYPKSSASGSDSSGTERSRMSLGTIPARSVHNENLKVILFGERGSTREIKISIEYRVEGSNAIFVKEKLYGVTINSTPINLSIDAPDSISPNQDITLNVKVGLNATKPASKILLRLDYPLGFQFASSTPATSFGNNVWDLGDLVPGAERNISIVGKMLDVFDGEEKIFQVQSGSQSAVDKSVIDVVFNSLPFTVAVKKPFIQAVLSINGEHKTEYAVAAKAPIRGTIQWTNNLDTKVNDLEIRAKILGNIVDRRTINADEGFYNSAQDTIIWDRNSESSFREISPGESQSVSFSLSSLSLFSAGGGVANSPLINIEVSISGKQSIEGYSSKEIKNFEASKIKIISDVGFAAKALYYSGPFKNTGPIPPKVEKETTYTITWSLSNTANNISSGVVKSSLPSWVQFANKVSPSSEDVTYNSSTRQITWNVGNITKGSGVTQTGKEVSFQVIFSPSLSQVKTTPVLIKNAVLTGHDDFANVNVEVSKTSLYTNLNNDPQFPAGGGVVAE